MPSPLILPLQPFLARLRFPTLFKVTVVLMLISWLWPFDPLPFIDEILTAAAVATFASWKKPAPAADESDRKTG